MSSEDDNKIVLTSKNVGLAFGLVLAAGLSTTIGAASVFVMKKTNLKMLAASLGISAGVMIYVSFVEIFAAKAVDGFVDAGYTDNEAARYATLCFFGGMVIIWLLDKLVHFILHIASHGRSAFDVIKLRKKERQASSMEDQSSGNGEKGSQQSLDQATLKVDIEIANQAGNIPQHCGCHAVAAVLSGQAAIDHNRQQASNPCGTSSAICSREDKSDGCDIPVHSPNSTNKPPERATEGDEVVAAVLQSDNGAGLSRMGLLAALAIGIHNLPEGLATFVGTLADPTAGIVIALAIALHNIPEGIVVAMPIFYASGSKWKAFFWGVLSGITEPIGALLGYAVLKGQEMDPLVYALLFGLVGGMMVYISLTELLPTALKYDPEDSVTTWAMVIGMVIMAASLLLFALN